MDDIELISKYKNLDNIQVLDIGCNDGRFVDRFLNKNGKVTAFDIQDLLPEGLKKVVVFSVDSVGSFSTNKKFDLIFSRNVFSFAEQDLKDILDKYLNYLNIGGIMFFTYFGDREKWFKMGKLKGITLGEIQQILSDLDNNIFEVIFFKELEFSGKTMNGTMKDWHQFKIIIKKIK
jgi:SAM-dependent methyltransferase